MFDLAWPLFIPRAENPNLLSISAYVSAVYTEALVMKKAIPSNGSIRYAGKARSFIPASTPLLNAELALGEHITF